MKKSQLITPKELAKRWKVHEGTIRNWRWQGRGPDYIRVGEGKRGKIVYKLSVVKSFEKRFNLSLI
jgi:hypothetical protein